MHFVANTENALCSLKYTYLLLGVEDVQPGRSSHRAGGLPILTRWITFLRHDPQVYPK